MSFGDWKLEKAVQALIDEAQALADRLALAKPHVIESYAAFAQVWAVTYLETAQDLAAIAGWKPTDVKRFIAGSQTKIAALRKDRNYDSSDGLAVWLHTARAVLEPRVAAPVDQIWRILQQPSANAEAMMLDLLQDAGLATGNAQIVPKQHRGL